MEKEKKAPDFCLPDEQGNPVCLNKLKGKWIILYFYPKDNTSGCTKEALQFTENKKLFLEKNAIIYGISPDDETSHQKFISKLSLGIPLLSDTEKKVVKLYGAWGTKKNYGKEYEGVIRSTFIINPDGIIVYNWQNVKVEQKKKDGIVKHSDIVFEKLIEVQKNYKKK